MTVAEIVVGLRWYSSESRAAPERQQRCWADFLQNTLHYTVRGGPCSTFDSNAVKYQSAATDGSYYANPLRLPEKNLIFLKLRKRLFSGQSVFLYIQLSSFPLQLQASEPSCMGGEQMQWWGAKSHSRSCQRVLKTFWAAKSRGWLVRMQISRPNPETEIHGVGWCRGICIDSSLVIRGNNLGVPKSGDSDSTSMAPSATASLLRRLLEMQRLRPTDSASALWQVPYVTLVSDVLV